MAIMKLTAFNGGMKGKVAGTIFQGSKAGQVVKTGIIDAISEGAKLSKADAARVIRNKANLATLASSWRSLSSTDRDSWNTGAVNFPFTNKFGDSYTGSGFQVYMSLNSYLLNSGRPAVDTCPTPGTIQNTNPFTVTSNTALDELLINGLTQVTGYTNTIYATRTLSTGRKPRQSDYKAVKVLAAGETFPYDFFASYTDLFGVIVPGGNLWVMITSINNNTGQPGVPYVAFVTV